MRPPPSGPLGDGPDPSPTILAALSLLQRARNAADELGLDRWQLAIDLTHLLAAGLSGADVRQLISDRLVESADERPPPRSGRRCFRRPAGKPLTARTCFVLTSAGERLLKHCDGRLAVHGAGRPRSKPEPSWDAKQRRLWWNGQLVKWFRVPAKCQETILAAFEEDGWPQRIDDPLPLVDGLDPHERLHEAVKGLNRGQVVRLLAFRRDGSGEGVEWLPREGR